MSSEVTERTPLQSSVSSDDISKTHCINVGCVEKPKSQTTVVSGVKVKHHRRYSSRKPTCQRLVEKNGRRNVRSNQIPRDRYLQDIFTTIIDAKWKWMILLLIVFYVGMILFTFVKFKLSYI